MIIQLSDLVMRKRPSAYKSRDGAYTVGGNKGIYTASYPRPYPKTPQQRKIAALAEFCKIRSGIKKSDLQTAMKDCLTTENYNAVR